MATIARRGKHKVGITLCVMPTFPVDAAAATTSNRTSPNAAKSSPLPDDERDDLDLRVFFNAFK